MPWKSIGKVQHSFRDSGVKQITNASVLESSEGTIFREGMRAKIL